MAAAADPLQELTIALNAVQTEPTGVASGGQWRPVCPNRVSNTKYTLMTFLPRNLWEQFGRLMNMYFLLIAVLQMWGRITPVNPATTWAPLFVIFAFTACKEAYDDICRYRRDSEVNSRQVIVIRDNRQVTVKSEEIAVGDTVLVKEGEPLPCDLVLLATSDPAGTCYLETAALDGETDLKLRRVPSCCSGATIRTVGGLQGSLKCGLPDRDCHSFRGSLLLVGPPGGPAAPPPELQAAEALSLQHAAFQCCHLRNTAWAAGIAVYTGNKTKLGMCHGSTPTKVARIDRRIDWFTACVFCGQIAVVCVMGSIGNDWEGSYAPFMYYLGYDASSSGAWYESLVIPLRFLLLCSIAVPISLKVTMDFVKAVYALLINWDACMHDPESGGNAVASNTSISEDLGQVKYVLSDKTGTLTENRMRFKYMFLGGSHYGGTGAVPLAPENQPFQTVEDLGPGALDDADLRQLAVRALSEPPGGGAGSIREAYGRAGLALRVLALCNSAVPRQSSHPADVPSGEQTPEITAELSSNSGGTVSYMAASPDEVVLVQAASHLGAALVQRKGDMAVLAVRQTHDRADLPECYSVLETLEFTSERRCMSVLVQLQGDRAGKIMLLMKGADDVVLNSLAEGMSAAEDAEARAAIELYATQGLRTMCLASRTVPQEEYETWLPKYRQAAASMEDREVAVAELCQQMEHSLSLLGVTAVEDKVQQDVPKTIRMLKDAGIAVWMLTGDKVSTATQLGYSTGLVVQEPGGQVAALTSPDPVEVGETLSRLQAQLADPMMLKQLTLVMDGATLRSAVLHHREALLQVATACASVLFCRVTPGQKAEVVRLLKGAEPRSIVLAVGDGGNDVGMIQAAHVGVGISGFEGQQAARAADYSIPTFRSLARMVFIHGRYSAVRTSFIAMYCIYKSIMLCFMQLLFAFASGASGTSFHSSFALMAYNVVFTLAPSLAYVLNKDADQETLLLQPHLLRPIQSGQCVAFALFGRWVLLAVYHASVIYFVMSAALASSTAGGRAGGDLELVAMAAYSVTIWVNALVVTMESHTISLVQAVATWGIVPLFYALTGAVSAFPRLGSYGVAATLFGSTAYWMALPLAMLLCAGPLLAVSVWQAGARSRIKELLQHHQLRLTRWRKEWTALGIGASSGELARYSGDPETDNPAMEPFLLESRER